MNALSNVAVFVLLGANLLFAQSTNSCEEQSSEKRLEESEKYKIARADSTKKYITAEYCLSFDKGEGWGLTLYKRIMPLVIKIQSNSYKYNAFMSIKINLDEDINIHTGFSIGGGSMRVGKNVSGEWVHYKLDRNEEYNIYDYFKTLYFFPSPEKTDTTKISTLFNKKKSLKWNLDFEIDYQPHNLSGTHNIYISGICTEEQLKKIEENNKKSKETKEGSKESVKNE